MGQRRIGSCRICGKVVYNRDVFSDKECREKAAEQMKELYEKMQENDPLCR